MADDGDVPINFIPPETKNSARKQAKCKPANANATAAQPRSKKNEAVATTRQSLTQPPSKRRRYDTPGADAILNVKEHRKEANRKKRVANASGSSTSSSSSSSSSSLSVTSPDCVVRGPLSAAVRTLPVASLSYLNTAFTATPSGVADDTLLQSTEELSRMLRYVAENDASEHLEQKGVTPWHERHIQHALEALDSVRLVPAFDTSVTVVDTDALHELMLDQLKAGTVDLPLFTYSHEAQLLWEHGERKVKQANGTTVTRVFPPCSNGDECICQSLQTYGVHSAFGVMPRFTMCRALFPLELSRLIEENRAPIASRTCILCHRFALTNLICTLRGEQNARIPSGELVQMFQELADADDGFKSNLMIGTNPGRWEGIAARICFMNAPLLSVEKDATQQRFYVDQRLLRWSEPVLRVPPAGVHVSTFLNGGTQSFARQMCEEHAMSAWFWHRHRALPPETNERVIRDATTAFQDDPSYYNMVDAQMFLPLLADLPPTEQLCTIVNECAHALEAHEIRTYNVCEDNRAATLGVVLASNVASRAASPKSDDPVVFAINKTLPQRCLARKFSRCLANIPVVPKRRRTETDLGYQIRTARTHQRLRLFLECCVCSLLGNYRHNDPSTRCGIWQRQIMMYLLCCQPMRLLSFFVAHSNIAIFVLRELIVSTVRRYPALKACVQKVFDFDAFEHEVITFMDAVRNLIKTRPEVMLYIFEFSPGAVPSSSPVASVAAAAEASSSATGLAGVFEQLVPELLKAHRAIRHTSRDVHVGLFMRFIYDCAGGNKLKREICMTKRSRRNRAAANKPAPVTPIDRDVSEAMAAFVLRLARACSPLTRKSESVLFELLRVCGPSPAFVEFIRASADAFYNNRLTRHSFKPRLAEFASAYPYSMRLFLIASVHVVTLQNTDVTVLPRHYLYNQLDALRNRFHLADKRVVPVFATQLVYCEVCNFIYTLIVRPRSPIRKVHELGYRGLAIDCWTGIQMCRRDVIKSYPRRMCAATPVRTVNLLGNVFRVAGVATMICPGAGCGRCMELDTRECMYTPRGYVCMDCTNALRLSMLNRAIRKCVDTETPTCWWLGCAITNLHGALLFPFGVLICENHARQHPMLQEYMESAEETFRRVEDVNARLSLFKKARAVQYRARCKRIKRGGPGDVFRGVA